MIIFIFYLVLLSHLNRIKTDIGDIQYGAPLSNISDMLEIFGDVPEYYIIPTTIFNKKNGVFVRFIILFYFFKVRRVWSVNKI